MTQFAIDVQLSGPLMLAAERVLRTTARVLRGTKYMSRLKKVPVTPKRRRAVCSCVSASRTVMTTVVMSMNASG